MTDDPYARFALSGGQFNPNPCSGNSTFTPSGAGEYHIHVAYNPTEYDGGFIAVISSRLAAEGLAGDHPSGSILYVPSNVSRFRVGLDVGVESWVYMRVELAPSHTASVWTEQEAGTEIYDPHTPYGSVQWDNFPPEGFQGLHHGYNLNDMPSEVWVDPEGAPGTSWGVPLYLTVTVWLQTEDNGIQHLTQGSETDNVLFRGVPVPRILQDGVDITDTTHDEIVGKGIHLQGQYNAPGVPIISRHWTIPGQAIGGFWVGPGDETNGPFTPGEVLVLGDLNRDTMSFYWKDGADGRQVTYTVVVGQDGAFTELSAQAAIDVKRPQATLSTVTRHVEISGAPGQNWYLALRFGDPAQGGLPGIEFHGSITMPDGFTGQSCYWQMHNQNHTMDVDTWLSDYWTQLVGAGVDTVIPYS